MYDNYFRIVNDFSIIIYARLSKEEVGKSKEEQSKSIKNQIEICQKYIADERKNYPNCNFEVIATLKDDGISGTTFDRANFKELVQLIEKKKANMVITTDLSRLGRDHITTDDYIEKWFPEHNVRYVSIVEAVDTYTDCISNDIAPIINWSNEHFAKLTSKKIKGRFHLLRLEGKWTGGEPPLGYKMDKKNKYHFIIDEKGAKIVKRIFSLFQQGKSIADIAGILTKEKIPIPTLIKGNRRNLNKDILELWSEDTIKDILTNEMYLGHMIQGKTTRLNHKSKKIIYLPRESWIKVENTHEPIIDEITFQEVQLLLKGNKNRNSKSHDYLLKGLLKCRECNHSIGIQHYKEKNNYTVCNYYRKYGRKKNVCTAHRLKYEELEQLVLESIKNDCLKYLDQKMLTDNLNNKFQNDDRLQIKTIEIKKCQREIANIKRQIDDIYEDKLNGLIDIEYYKKVIKGKKELLKDKNQELNYLILELDDYSNIVKPDVNKILEEFISFKKPKKVFIASLIDAIYISKEGEISIYYKIRDPKL